MSKLSAAQLAGLVQMGDNPHGNAGMSTQARQTFVAIALAESGGDPNAVSTTNDYGLWQINKVAHGNLFNNYRWSEPQQNWLMAKSVYAAAGNKFTPWSTYKNGAYLQFMGTAANAVAKPDLSTVDSNIIDNEAQSGVPGATAIGKTAQAGDQLITIGEFLTKLSQASTWVRVGMALGGALLIILAFASVIGKTALSTTPIGKLAKVLPK